MTQNSKSTRRQYILNIVENAPFPLNQQEWNNLNLYCLLNYNKSIKQILREEV